VQPPEFTHEITLPCLGETIRLRELPNKLYKNILKYIENKDYNALAEYFVQIIDYLCIDFKDISSLNKVDMFYILLFVRYVCVSPELKLDFECQETKKPYTLNVDITEVMDGITKNAYPSSAQIIELDYGIAATIGIPTNLYTSETLLDLVTLCLQEIAINDNVYSLHDCTYDEKKNVTDQLQGELLPSILRFIAHDSDTFTPISILDSRSPHTSASESKPFNVNLFDNSMFEFLHLIYTESLTNYFYTLYILTSKVHLDSEFIQNLSPVECNIYLRQYVNEIEAKNSEIKKQQQSNSMGLPNTIGNDMM
jgi:hypothetical protein